jgi:hypothetical protein
MLKVCKSGRCPFIHYSFRRHQIECLTGSEKIFFSKTNLMSKHSSEHTIQVNQPQELIHKISAIHKDVQYAHMKYMVSSISYD